MLDSLSSLLELFNYQVDTALGGKEGIEKLSSNNYDLLLLDLKNAKRLRPRRYYASYVEK